jgi:3-oxoadipate enol-lactonase
VAHWEGVLETMDALGIEQTSIVGNSFGGAVALRVAALSPERVSSLLLFSVAAVPEPDPSPELLAVWDAEEEALSAGDIERAVEAVVSAWVRPEASDEVRERVAAMQRRNYELHASEQGLEQAPDPLEEDLALLSQIDCSTLLAVGKRDMVDFKNAVGDLAAKLPQAITAEIADCGHLAPLEAPEEFRRLVLENLGSSPVGS